MSRRFLDRDIGPLIWPSIWLMGIVSMIAKGSVAAAILLLPVLPWFGYRCYRVFRARPSAASGERDSAPPASGYGGKIAGDGLAVRIEGGIRAETAPCPPPPGSPQSARSPRRGWIVHSRNGSSPRRPPRSEAASAPAVCG